MLAAFRTAAAAVAFKAPTIPFVSSLTGRLVEASDVTEPDFWARQIREPVQFARGCETLVAEGTTVVVEVGPGRGLSALARQCGLAARGIDIVTMLPDPNQPTAQIATTLGRLWLAGVDVNWTDLYAGETRRRVALPTYPFNRQRYWIDPALNFQRTESADKRQDAREWLYAPSWKQLAPVAKMVSPQTEGTRRVLIVGEAGGLGGRMATALRATGHDVSVLDETTPATLDRLIEGWTGPSDTPDRILHLASLAPVGETETFDEPSFWADQERNVLGLLRLLQTVTTISAGKPLAVHIVSTGLYDVTGADPLVAAHAPLVTFARVAAQEIAHVTCRVLDIETLRPNADLDGLVARIEARFAATGAKDTVLAMRQRRFWRLEYEQIDADVACEPTRVTRERGVYLITGGLGKVGLVFARYLATTCRARLVLLGRSTIPARDTWDALLDDKATNLDLRDRILAIRELESFGAEVMAASADVSNENEMAGVLRKAEERFGSIDGIIHCAGVTTVARVVLDTGLPEFEQNFRSKVFGLIVLQKLFAAKPVDFGMVVSSLSAVLGGLGHMAYAAANAVADTLVLAQNQAGSGVWTTVDWDAWKFNHGRIDGIQGVLNMLDLSMDETEGTRAIDLLMAMQAPEQVIVSTGPLNARVKLWIEQHAMPRGAADSAALDGIYKRPDVETPFAEPEGPIEIRLAAIWREALGLDRVGRNDDFFEIGGHSLLAVQILAKTREAFGVDFPLDRAQEAGRLSSAAVVIESMLSDVPHLEAAE